MSPKIKNIIHRIESSLAKHHHEDQKLDFIGDVHGHAKQLITLLTRLNYHSVNGTWTHSEYKAVFVGDFINRGPHNREVIEIVRAMVKCGSAYAILGNHEINAICYFTRNSKGKPLRTPGPSNKRFLEKIRMEYKNDPDTLAQHIKWLKKLPLFIDFGHVRVIHAYWNQMNIELINGALSEGKLKKKLLKEIITGQTAVSKAFLQSIRGIEYMIPHNMIVVDLFNERRMYFRVKWWLSPENLTFNQLNYESKVRLPDLEIPKQIAWPYDVYTTDLPPLFVGHYCMNNGEMIPSPNVCCIDACVANGGKLAAYRWNGQKKLSYDDIIYSD